MKRGLLQSTTDFILGEYELWFGDDMTKSGGKISLETRFSIVE